jgi:hypothetical protein
MEPGFAGVETLLEDVITEAECAENEALMPQRRSVPGALLRKAQLGNSPGSGAGVHEGRVRPGGPRSPCRDLGNGTEEPAGRRRVLAVLHRRGMAAPAPRDNPHRRAGNRPGAGPGGAVRRERGPAKVHPDRRSRRWPLRHRHEAHRSIHPPQRPQPRVRVRRVVSVQEAPREASPLRAVVHAARHDRLRQPAGPE